MFRPLIINTRNCHGMDETLFNGYEMFVAASTAPLKSDVFAILGSRGRDDAK
jgi:hypothetical protein